MPIPHYIRKGVGDDRDRQDYQTLYAREVGSVAAPTAGLHFTPQVFHRLAARGVACHYLTLHIGQGTFAPVKVENLGEHRMHRETFSLPQETQRAIQQNWGELYCVGTTCLRVLESLADREGNYTTAHAPPLGGSPQATDIFLHPGKPISSIKGLVTNFHLPQSSLFILICALIGRQKALKLYQVAKDKEYRFFSYGDAMLVLR